VCVVGNYAETRVGRVFLHDAAQGHLGCGCHGVGLVEDNQLEARESGIAFCCCWGHGENLFCACTKTELAFSPRNMIAPFSM
jgi:hypothetical protein